MLYISVNSVQLQLAVGRQSNLDYNRVKLFGLRRDFVKFAVKEPYNSLCCLSLCTHDKKTLTYLNTKSL